MTSIRSIGLLLALVAISACDKDPTPPKAPPAPKAPAVSQSEPAAEVAKPAAKTAKQPTVKPLEPLIKSTLEPLPEKPESAAADKQLEPPSTPKTVTVRAPQPPDKIQRLQVNKTQTPAQKKASAAVKKTEVPKAKLDLRLPKDLVKNLEPKVAVTPGASPAPSKTADPALLPQMFADKPGDLSPFEVGGRVITNERTRDQDENMFDGAELQFKFRH